MTNVVSLFQLNPELREQHVPEGYLPASPPRIRRFGDQCEMVQYINPTDGGVLWLTRTTEKYQNAIAKGDVAVNTF